MISNSCYVYVAERLPRITGGAMFELSILALDGIGSAPTPSARTKTTGNNTLAENV